MSSTTYHTKDLNIKEIKAIYDISRMILHSEDTYSALNQIVVLARPVFIFDIVVLYQNKEGPDIEPIYAKAIGRGRSVEADLAWGEKIALDVFQKDHIILRNELQDKSKSDQEFDRVLNRFFLGLPLRVSEKFLGALVFIRFGGPAYSPDKINLAKFIAEHVSQLLERQTLVDRIVDLKASRKISQLQENFIATVSHDLRTPLGYIKGYATTLLREDTDWDKATRGEFLTIIDEEADRLEGLINNLLDSSRLQTGTLGMQLQPVRLNILLKNLAHRIDLSDQDLEIKLDLDPSEFTINADPPRLVQVFDNLISNAVKYAQGSDVTVSLKYADDNAHISVTDKGPGIPKEHLTNIFERFFRLPRHSSGGRGIGLGLFICKEIINSHNGKIYAESEENRGTTFHILLPYIQNIEKKSNAVVRIEP